MKSTVSRATYCGCLYYSANALARKMSRLAEEEFAPTGLAPSPAFIVLTVLKKPGITAGKVADIVQLQPSTVTRFMDKLEKEGFIVRQAEGKFMRVHPTPKATRLDGPLHSAWQQLYRRYTRILGEEPSAKLAATIYAASNALEQD